MTEALKVRVVQGDLFESEAQALVNTVNTVGVMGKGIALGFKKRFPEMYVDYVARCERGEVKLGKPYIWKPLMPPWVINFPTKGHWRAQSRLADIERGLEYLREHIAEWGVESLAVPPLGCGEGGLEWRIVGPVLFERLSELGIPIVLYAPFETPHEQLQPEFLSRQLDFDQELTRQAPESRIPASAVALVEIVSRLSANRFQSPVGRVFFQKLAYFATRRGVPTGLSFQRGSYGPFADGLKPLTSKLVNNGLLEEIPSGRMIVMQPGRSYGEGRKAFASELAAWNTAIEDLVDLASRMGTRQAEVAATVHFVATELAEQSPGQPVREIDVYNAVQDWKARRDPPFKPEEIASAVRNLALLGWLDLELSPELEVEDAVFA